MAPCITDAAVTMSITPCDTSDVILTSWNFTVMVHEEFPCSSTSDSFKTLEKLDLNLSVKCPGPPIRQILQVKDSAIHLVSGPCFSSFIFIEE